MDDCRLGKKNTIICLFCKSRISRGNRESLQDGSTFYLYTDNKEMLWKKRKQLKANFSDYSTFILHIYSFLCQIKTFCINRNRNSIWFSPCFSSVMWHNKIEQSHGIQFIFAVLSLITADFIGLTPSTTSVINWNIQSHLYLSIFSSSPCPQTSRNLTISLKLFEPSHRKFLYRWSEGWNFSIWIKLPFTIFSLTISSKVL